MSEKIKLSKKEVQESKAKAFEQIKKFLDADDVDGQFAGRSGDYYSKEKFIVSWNQNWNGMPAEYSISKTDSFYQAYAGYKAVYTTQGLFHEKQFKGFPSIERALIEVGVKLAPKEEQQEFWTKYATRYNDKIKAKQKETEDD